MSITARSRGDAKRFFPDFTPNGGDIDMDQWKEDLTLGDASLRDRR